MKTRITYYFGQFREGIATVSCLHPVEIALALLCCLAAIAAYEADCEWWIDRLPLAGIFFALALVVNTLAGRGPWRKVYWVCWLPIVPLALWPGLEAWYGTTACPLTFAVLIPLALLLCRRAVRNERFVYDAAVWLRAGVLALLFANVALGLFCAILYSTTYIFGLQGMWIDHLAIYAVIFCESLLFPVLFLMMSDRWSGSTFVGNKILTVLLNYIVTPAVLIYTAILYLYMLRILISWSLPAGGVAYLVFWFTLLVLLVKAFQQLLDKRLYDWFFDRFSLISLPTQVLFWVGVVRRTNEYGLTEPRVFLLVCGGLMTLCVLLFLTRRTGRYLYVCLAGFLTFAALAYVPGLYPERIAVRSQVHRTERIAERLGLLGPDGRLQLEGYVFDTLHRREYRSLYESLCYVKIRDEAAFTRFVADMEEFETAVPDILRKFVVNGFDYDTDYHTVYTDSGRRTTGIAGYNTMYMDMTYWAEDGTPKYRFDKDTLCIQFGGDRPDFCIATPDLQRTLLLQAGIAEDNPNPAVLDAAADRLLQYADRDVMILFSYVRFNRSPVFTLDDVSIEAVLTR